MVLSLSKKIRIRLRKIIGDFSPTLLYKILQIGSKPEPELELIPFLCAKTKTSLDIGANMGLYTRQLIKYSEHCWAFEPNPELAKHLRRMFKSQVTVEEVALSNKTGFTDIRVPLSYPALATVENSNILEGIDDIKSIPVPEKKLDQYQIKQIGFIKIDVEGHEQSVLEGAIKHLSRDKPSLIIEIEDRHQPNSIQIARNFLEKLGYQGFFFLDGKLEKIENFNLQEHQNLKNLKNGMIKVGVYINNFIFIDSKKIDQISEFIK